MDKPKYPISLFIVGFLMNFTLRHLVLFLGAIILIIVSEPGEFFHYVGIVMLCIDAVLSFILQLSIRNQVINADSDSPEMQRLQAALSKEGRWVDNVKYIVEEKIEEHKENNEE